MASIGGHRAEWLGCILNIAVASEVDKNKL